MIFNEQGKKGEKRKRGFVFVKFKEYKNQKQRTKKKKHHRYSVKKEACILAIQSAALNTL